MILTSSTWAPCTLFALVRRALFRTLASSPADPGKLVKVLKINGLDAIDGLAENALVHTPNVDYVSFESYLINRHAASHHSNVGKDREPSEPSNDSPGHNNDSEDRGRFSSSPLSRSRRSRVT
jgi:hypothetical protein